ncbi:MAG: sulfatase [Planctomycetes bacterium]|nr:sulfatase [Planctomycetota bacterium]
MRMIASLAPACGGALLLLAACGGSDAPSNSGGSSASPAQDGLELVLAAYDGIATPRTNVLLISLDSTRRDMLSCYGHVPQFAPNEKTTPNIDRLAAEGVKMEEAYSTTSWTLPSHMSLMTGQPELVHGVDLDPFKLGEATPTLAAILRRVGYYTAGHYSGPYLHARYGFDRGFDTYSAAYGPDLAEANAERARLQSELDAARQTGDAERQKELQATIGRIDRNLDNLSHRDRSSQSVTDAAIASVERGLTAGRPWFVMAHYFDPHFDYVPPEELAKRFDPDYDGQMDSSGFWTTEKVGRRKPDEPDWGIREQVCSARDLDHLKALYAADLHWTDSQVGRLLEHLRSKRLLENTLVVVVADHGDEFFEHGGLGHRHTLYEEQVRIPMVLRLPSSLPQGQAVKGLVSLTDVLPTVLELLDLPLPESLISRSFLALAQGKEDGADRFVLGRLVQYLPLQRIGGPPVVRINLRETYRKGALKLERWRRWHEALPTAPPEIAAQVKASAGERDKDLVLVWTDFAGGSQERSSDFSTDWKDARAQLALGEWRKVYVQAQRAAKPSEIATIPGASAAQLQALGYVNAQASSRTPYDLPPPGEHHR